ncbi:uncharacterized protein LOC141664873 [Apium graveolens]|uniref:uncharacterized protein LOC141664873 n=1 Tax=Apium graveolens TaxID=4045 RepID=UPI003D7AF41A
MKRAGDTRWGSHYGTLVSVISMFESIVDVLDFIVEDGLNSEQRGEAFNLLVLIQSFDFIFSLHLMKVILGITNELSIVLQRKENDIVNAMQLVKLVKYRIQTLRNEGWDELLNEVCLFCEKQNIIFPSMDENFQMKGRSRRKVHQVTNLYHYKVEFFYVILDLQLQELNNSFSQSSMELLICIACLSLNNAFSAFDKEKLLRLAQFYPSDFSSIEPTVLDNQLSTYILGMRSSDEFSMLNGIGALAEKLVLKNKSMVYPLVYLLVKLALILPVTTASVERGFSAMKIVKNRLRNRMGDQLLNDSLVTYIEKSVFDGIVNEAIMQRIQNMKNRREQL